MKKGYTYTIIFMAVVSIIFTGLLAGVNAAYKKKITKNEETAMKASILASVGINTDGVDVNGVFNDKATEEKLNEVTYYSIMMNSDKTVYAIPFEGAGLWGTIRGFVGVSTDYSSIVGLAFTDQNETPGLGGRIDEDWYKEQFRGASLETVIEYGNDSGLDAITGATSTSNAVLKILNGLMDTTLQELEEADEK